MKSKELKKILKLVSKTAVGAGEILEFYEKKIHKIRVNNKPGQGVVSEADLACEEYILKKLKSKFPEFGFLGEESSFVQNPNQWEVPPDDRPTWIVDPLDGTNNFLAGFPFYAVCIGLYYKKQAILGVVYQPSEKNLYYAFQEGGAFLDSRKEKNKRLYNKENQNPLKRGIFSTGFAAEKGIRLEGKEDEFNQLKHMIKEVMAVRRLGSAALDMCLVARQVLDGFWEQRLAPWDVCASGAICQEAGVILSDYTGNEFSPFDSSIVAARSPVHEQLVALLNVQD